MYEKHPEFLEPESQEEKLWRYMDLGKFLSILHTNCLYFARGDKFEDPYEGMLTDFIAENIKSADESGQKFKMWHQHHLNTRYDTYINCWHINSYESAAMWRLYSAKHAGIAIQSSFRSLIESISKTDELIYVGVVRYGDKHLRGNAMPNAFAFWMTKRKSFEYERELRAVIHRPRNLGIGTMAYKGEQWQVVGYPVSDSSTPVGINVEVNLTDLIHRVVISPETPDSMIEVIKEAAHRFGHSFTIERSKLYQISFLDT